MLQQNIITGAGNPVVILLTGVNLNDFTDIKAEFGEDSRTLLLNPESVVINSATELQLNFQDTGEIGSKFWTICGFNATYPSGFELTSKRLGNMNSSSVI